MRLGERTDEQAGIERLGQQADVERQVSPR